MKAIYLSLVFLLTIGNAIAQDSAKSEEMIFYTMFGASIPAAKNQHVIGNASVVVELKDKYLLALRYYGQEYKEEVPASDHVNDKYIPSHIYNEVNVSVGKIKHFHEKLRFSFSTGPSFVTYEMPYNLKKVPHPNNSWGGFFNSSIYEYDVRKYNLPGWSVRADLAFIPKQKFGLSLGAFFNYNRKLPIGGLNVNVLLGKIKPSVEEI